MGLFERTTIKAKLLLVLLISLLAMVALIAVSGVFSYQRMMQDRQAQVRSIVEAAISLGDGLDKDIQAQRLSKADAEERFRGILHTIRYNNGVDYLFAYDMNAMSFANASNPKAVGQDRSQLKDANGKLFVKEIIDVVRDRGTGVVTYWWPKLDAKVASPKLVYAAKFPAWNLVIGSGVYTDDIDNDFESFMIRLAVIAAGLILVACLVVLMIRRDVVRSLDSLRQRMGRLADGDLTADFPEVRLPNEIGAMAKAVAVFKENAEAKRRMEGEQAAQAERAEREKQETMQRIAGTFETSVGGLLGDVGRGAKESETKASAMSEATRETKDRAVAVAAAMHQAAANVQTVASASEELASSIREIGQQVSASTAATSEAVVLAQRTNEKILSLSDVVEKIGSIVHLINDIASQTNLLALNATIEAARAGEAGKGFAVVAGEVKQLANQTAKATSEIGEQVRSVQTVTGEAVDEIQGVNQVIQKLNETAAAIAAAVEEQGAATAEISRNIQQVSTGVEEVSGHIEGVRTTAEANGVTADEMFQTAHHLALQADRINQEVSSFLATIRS
ncbi:methyl-accepting chemotaxis protein [Telmatospirillum sp.]|uniref:methyl-accepting chemotaxis protein n=1 Tax=Telmatospirillum sp. TaxID=2079197 RepID=UPI00284C1E47|nr:methyl-accepting chemotaxis protein [Telmatospirillum sp.]MDR3437678.1 methyl-accepting chemotaxis protein [Telmatospirillum sp.]